MAKTAVVLRGNIHQLISSGDDGYGSGSGYGYGYGDGSGSGSGSGDGFTPDSA